MKTANKIRIVILTVIIAIGIIFAIRLQRGGQEGFQGSSDVSKPRVAFLVKGAMANHKKDFQGDMDKITTGDYINFVPVYNGFKKHIFDVNNSYDFDTFMFSWNTDLEKQLSDLYRPVVSRFEDNSKYKAEFESKIKSTDQFSQVSQAYAIQRVVELMEIHSKEKGTQYDYVIIVRPDVLLWKDIDLSKYKKDRIYVNDHPNRDGDFHFVMSQENAGKFKRLYNSVSEGNIPQGHMWIRNFVDNYLKIPYEADGIVPGNSEEVVRKIREFSINKGGINEAQLLEYGFTAEDIKRL